MQLDVINRLFLELSQFATARTAREIELEGLLANASADERERCARIADELYHNDNRELGLIEYDGDVANAIRAQN